MCASQTAELKSAVLHGLFGGRRGKGDQHGRTGFGSLHGGATKRHLVRRATDRAAAAVPWLARIENPARDRSLRASPGSRAPTFCGYDDRSAGRTCIKVRLATKPSEPAGPTAYRLRGST